MKYFCPNIITTNFQLNMLLKSCQIWGNNYLSKMCPTININFGVKKQKFWCKKSKICGVKKCCKKMQKFWCTKKLVSKN